MAAIDISSLPTPSTKTVTLSATPNTQQQVILPDGMIAASVYFESAGHVDYAGADGAVIAPATADVAPIPADQWVRVWWVGDTRSGTSIYLSSPTASAVVRVMVSPGIRV